MESAQKAPKGAFWRYALLTAVAFIFVFPLLFMMISSLKPDLQLLTDTESLRGIGALGFEAVRLYYDTDESKEGAAAFREKRPPRFRKPKK